MNTKTDAVVQIEWGDWSRDGHNQSRVARLRVHAPAGYEEADVRATIKRAVSFCDYHRMLRHYEEGSLTTEQVQTLRDEGIQLPSLLWCDEYDEEGSPEYQKLLEPVEISEEWEGQFEDLGFVELFFIALLNHFSEGRLHFKKDDPVQKFTASFGYGCFYC